MQPFNSIETHYTRDHIFETILSKLKEQGISHPTRKNIGGIDEFHVRGASVSIELANQAGFKKDSRVLDIGCGLGGPARMIAEDFGCMVTGIDLTAEFIRSATLLSELVNLQSRTNFIQGNALDLPFENESFDVVWTQHVQMNISDKEKFYSEMERVLVKGGKFIYYDVFKKSDAPISYPLPWADDSEMSFLFSTTALEKILTDKGLRKISTTDQTNEAIKFFEQMFAKMAAGEMPKLALDLLIGTSSKDKFGNLYKNVVEKRLELQSGIFQKN